MTTRKPRPPRKPKPIFKRFFGRVFYFDNKQWKSNPIKDVRRIEYITVDCGGLNLGEVKRLHRWLTRYIAWAEYREKRK